MIQAVKGTSDLFGEKGDAYEYIGNLFAAICELYGYKKIVTPIIEHAEVFSRSSGDSTDIVRKQMYEFKDKGERNLVLRPEGTAGVIRCLIENKLYATSDLPIKLHYNGPMFRYERPQLGRQRQFYQAGVEAVGVDSPLLDAETIALATQILSMLGIEKTTLKVNCLGDEESRKAYANALKEYFAPHLENMCQDCKQRYLLNPLRILDCKVSEDIKLAKAAPKIENFLSDNSKAKFKETLDTLDELGVEYEIDTNLVRGLDYYSEIVFEVVATTKNGTDYGALLGGGHYSGLMSALGGPKENDVGAGFAMGIERVYSFMKEEDLLEDLTNGVDLYLIPIGEEAIKPSFVLAENLRAIGYSCITPYSSGKLATLFKKAEKAGAKYAIIIGEDEINNGKVQLKNLTTKEQREVDVEKLDIILDEEFEVEEHHH